MLLQHTHEEKHFEACAHLLAVVTDDGTHLQFFLLSVCVIKPQMLFVLFSSNSPLWFTDTQETLRGSLQQTKQLQPPSCPAEVMLIKVLLI